VFCSLWISNSLFFLLPSQSCVLTTHWYPNYLSIQETDLEV